MKAHELAKLLLRGPDVEVKTFDLYTRQYSWTKELQGLVLSDSTGTDEVWYITTKPMNVPQLGSVAPSQFGETFEVKITGHQPDRPLWVWAATSQDEAEQVWQVLGKPNIYPEPPEQVAHGTMMGELGDEEE